MHAAAAAYATALCAVRKLHAHGTWALCGSPTKTSHDHPEIMGRPYAKFRPNTLKTGQFLATENWTVSKICGFTVTIFYRF